MTGFLLVMFIKLPWCQNCRKSDLLLQKTNTVVVEKRLDEVTQELRKSEGKTAALQTDLQSANSALDTAHKETVALQVKLQELERSLIGHDQAARDKDEKLKVRHTRNKLRNSLKVLDIQNVCCNCP